MLLNQLGSTVSSAARQVEVAKNVFRSVDAMWTPRLQTKKPH